MRCGVKKKLFDKEKWNAKKNALQGKMNPKINQLRWVLTGLVVSGLGALVLTGLYMTFRTGSAQTDNTEYEDSGRINTLTQTTYVLYHDLYNKINNTNADYYQIYLQPNKGYENLFSMQVTEESNMIAEASIELPETVPADDETDTAFRYSNEVNLAVVDMGDLSDEESLALEEFRKHQSIMDGYFNELEAYFDFINTNYDYWIEDLESGTYIANISEEVKNYYEKGNVYFRLKILYDANGNATVEDATGLDYSQIRKDATVALRDNSLYHLFDKYGVENNNDKYYSVTMPKNCRVIYYVSLDDYWDLVAQSSKGFSYSNAWDAFFLVSIIVFLTAILWPWGKEYKPWKQHKILRAPIEALFCVIFVWMILAADSVENRAYNVAYAYQLRMDGKYFAWVYQYFLNLLLLVILLMVAWYGGVCIRSVMDMGFVQYCKERLLCVDICRFCKKKALQTYDKVMHWDVTSNSKKMILKIVLINALILLVISSLWFVGFAITIIYSVILYLILRKVVSDIQQKYALLLDATNQMAEGNLDVNISEDLGVFEPFKPELLHIQSGFKNAVEQEVKSQKMKAELITNVSHDLKTPLTAIITYINLLQDENITEEQRKEYLDTLDRKSIRLKVLIEDLFEVSKANSQNMKLDLVKVDLMNLIKQVSYEMTDKMENAKLDVRLNLPEEKALVLLDSQKTYRIYENLFGNIAKYAMAGTRVYITGTVVDDSVVVTLKNITAEELTVSAEDLTERFVRGDASRNTEGSGLGLAIAKSFTEIQGGKFSIELDDDIFKVTTIFKLISE